MSDFSEDAAEPERKLRLLEELRANEERQHDTLIRIEDSMEKPRRNLLLASSITFGISITDAVPTKIEALGIDFSSKGTEQIFLLLSLLCFYFVLKFTMLISRNRDRRLTYSTILSARERLLKEFGDSHPDYRATTVISYRLRTLVDSFFPWFFGVSAMSYALFVYITT